MTAHLRAFLDALPSYIPGKHAPGAISLASNETVDGPLPSVTEAISHASATVNRYPDTHSTQLRQALAHMLNLTPEHIYVADGSAPLCQALIHITCAPGDEVIMAWRSFEFYPLAVRMSCAQPIQIPLTPDYRHDLPAMAAAITPRTRAIFVCTPNNPTGTTLTVSELTQFLDTVPSSILVILDEAYFEYLRSENNQTPINGVDLLATYSNLVVLRTFSKAYGLAGLRVGYAAAHPKIISALAKAFPPFSVNSIAQQAALASLSVQKELFERTHYVVAERNLVQKSLREYGYTTAQTQANFVWIDLADASAAFADAAAQAHLLVRPFPGNGVRVTITTRNENTAFLNFARTWISSQP